jgi:hypothetical protein
MEVLTVLLCSLASASGTTLYRPSASTTAKPCSRSAEANWLNAAPGWMARSVTKFMVPFTRGSTTTSRPVTTAMVRATASMSALAKFSVMGSPRRGASPCANTTGAACRKVAAISTRTASATVPVENSGFIMRINPG